ncbi:hypothetical protein Slin15195_G022820 [Septoria linicola]|uniref:Uncharacterized protein n=1 Tax=Septoria linicola TaxID=215465 RepID=A0A9Q9EH56_9PEZI|nr:hypothetical protein Slin15195_G022820 [Septoria linicola]
MPPKGCASQARDKASIPTSSLPTPLTSNQATSNTIVTKRGKVYEVTAAASRPKRGTRQASLVTAAPADPTINHTNAEPDPELNLSTGKTHFRFSDLAPELRNIVYERHLEDVDVCLPSSRSGDLIVCSPLLVLSKKFGKEFRDLAVSTAFELVTHVVHYDFQHVVDFLEHSAREDVLQRLDSGSQKLKIVLSFPGHVYGTEERTPDDEQLVEWLNRAGDPARRGNTIDTLYEATIRDLIKMDCWSDWPWPPYRFYDSDPLYHAWDPEIFGGPNPNDSNFPEARNREADKIRHALISWYVDYGLDGLRDEHEEAHLASRDSGPPVSLKLYALYYHRCVPHYTGDSESEEECENGSVESDDASEWSSDAEVKDTGVEHDKDEIEVIQG